MGLTPASAAGIGIAAIGLFIIGRGNVTSLRLACGSVLAERFVIGLTLVAFVLATVTAVTLSLPVFVAAVVITGFADITPGPIIALTGGPDRSCQFRRAMREVLVAMQIRPLTEQAIEDARRAYARLERIRSNETEAVFQKLGTYLDRRFPEIDHEAAVHAYEELQTAIAELKSRHPW